MQLDQPLREHAQLARAVHAFRKVGRLDDVLRQLPHALVGVHGGCSQGAKGVIVRQALGAHQDALGPVHRLALFKASGHLVIGLALLLHLLVPCLGQMDECAQAVGAIAMHHIHMHTAFRGLGDVGGVGVMGKHDGGARERLLQRLQCLKPRAGGQGHIADHHIWCVQHHGLHQLAAIFHRGHDRNARRGQVRRQGGGGLGAVDTQQGGSHKNQW